MKRSLLPLLATACLIACGKAPEPAPPEPAKETKVVEPAKPVVTLTAEERMAEPAGLAFRITSPREGEVISGNTVNVKFDLSGWDIKEGDAHVHFILDNTPYKPIYDSKTGFSFEGLEPGAHVIRAFPSRPHHESVKLPEAFQVVQFFVGEKPADGAKVLDPAAPLLTYSRPKGKYEGEAANRILVDFWLSNADLAADGNKVRLTVDGQEFMIDAWKPNWLEGLGAGEHTLTLELLDAAGAPVPGPYNSTTRTIEVVKAAP